MWVAEGTCREAQGKERQGGMEGETTEERE